MIKHLLRVLIGLLLFGTISAVVAQNSDTIRVFHRPLNEAHEVYIELPNNLSGTEIKAMRTFLEELINPKVNCPKPNLCVQVSYPVLVLPKSIYYKSPKLNYQKVIKKIDRAMPINSKQVLVNPSAFPEGKPFEFIVIENKGWS